LPRSTRPAQDAEVIPPDTRYAKTADGVHIAFQVVGEGPVDLAWQFDWVGNVDLIWDHPLLGFLLRGLSSFSRLILHDRRGTGLSSRNVEPPNLETRVADLRVVLDAIGSVRPVLAAALEGGAPNILFAASQPDRVHSIVWWAPTARCQWAPDYPWGAGPDYVANEHRSLERWGTSAYGQAFAETEAKGGQIISEARARATAMLSRHTVTPDVALALSRIWYETDVRGVIPSVKAPTLLIVREGMADDVQEAEYVASLLSDVRMLAIPSGPEEETLDDIEIGLEGVRRFVGIEQPAPDLDRILSTVLFTDIVKSTEIQVALGDRSWKSVIERHHAIVREALGRWRGVENDTAGDGFYATFDGPARAIRCAMDIAERVRDLGLEIRAGVHTGECEVIDAKCGGLAVTIGARVAANAGPSEVLVSQTVKDLVAGSALTFEDRGETELKGVPNRWRLYRAVAS
jgi:class 3 adenylate cyclase